MSELSHASSRRMYSWWWDSHISPQNSRWLVENLTDMDVKVKSMIKLIEQDADSFASRAEMYYEKRPELMKMVEEFYRAYRALAEKYNHATGALRQAHWTITENFPSQVTSEITEDELEIFAEENNPQAPEDSYEARSEDRKGLEQFNDSLDDENIGELSKVLARFEAEKEFSLAQYKKSLEKLSHQEREFSNAQESSKGLAERVSKSEDEVESLRKTLEALESKNDKTLVQYQKCLESIGKMEGIISIAKNDVLDLNERAQKAETEAKILKIDLATLESEKATSLDQCKQYLDKILNLEHKLVISEDEAKKLNKIAEEAKAEAESLKQDHYQNCSDIISNLEQKLYCAQEKVQMLNGEVKNGVVKLKGAEEQSIDLEKSKQYLHVKLETLKLEMGAQSEELTEKKREIDLLLTSIEFERLRFVKAETDFQLLQLLQAQTEKELNSLSLELENRSLIVSDLETRNQSLNELNLASSLSLKDTQSEILSLKEAEKQLKKEVKIRVDQKNTLQQEIRCLKEELNDLYKKYHTMLDQVEGLQNENLNLKETRERESKEKVDLSKRLENLEKVDEKNSILQNSLSNISAEFEGAREEIIAMVKSIQSLFEEKNILDSEKASLATQLQVANENLEKLSEKNNLMENIVFDAHNEIEGLKMRLKDIEDSCERLEEIEKKYLELEEKHSVLKKEREFTLCEVEELRSIAKESKLKEDKQMIEIENLHGKVLSTKKTSVEFQEKNLKLIDEKISLVKNFLGFQDENNSLNTASLDNLSLIFKNIINERGLEIEELRSTVDKLTGTLESLEENNSAKDKSFELLIEKISILEGENGKIKAQLAGYVSAISSLKDSISSLENGTCFSIHLRDNNNEQVKATIENHVEGHNEFIVDKKETDKLPELQMLVARIKIIEKTVIETYNKLEAATRQIEELGSKDVVLDKKSNMNGEERIIKGVHFDLGVTVEKELGMDKVVTAKRFSLPNQELDKTMILDRLNSDSQKLTDLQITVQDLRRKGEMSEKPREGKSFDEYERRLKKADEDIKQLSDLNGTLMKSVEKADDVKDVVESEENRNMREKISEEARKVSERIGQLEFEVQKIQYIMLKLGDESGKENISNKSEITENKKTSFRNYLGLKTSSRTKKRAFCGFVHPPTIED